MGMEARNISHKDPNPTSSEQRIETGSTGDLTSTRSPTVEELSLSLEAVTRKVTIIEGRMSLLEASFEYLLQKTAELREELSLAREQLAIRNQGLVLLERSRTEPNDILGEAERLRLEDVNDIGER